MSHLFLSRLSIYFCTSNRLPCRIKRCHWSISTRSSPSSDRISRTFVTVLLLEKEMIKACFLYSLSLFFVCLCRCPIPTKWYHPSRDWLDLQKVVTHVMPLPCCKCRPANSLFGFSFCTLLGSILGLFVALHVVVGFPSHSGCIYTRWRWHQVDSNTRVVVVVHDISSGLALGGRLFEIVSIMMLSSSLAGWLYFSCTCRIRFSGK